MTQTIATVALVVFALSMMTIGIFSMRKAQTMEGFLLGGRKMGPWISAFAYGTSYFSAVVFIGYAGMHGWKIGIGSIWIGIGNAIVGCYLAWRLLARRTRTMTHKIKASTMPEFLERRFNSSPMKVYAAIIIFVFLVPYAASVYKGLGVLFSAIFPGSSEIVCMAIVAALTAVYLVLGGYVATAVNDFIQGIIMLAGVVLMIAAIISRPEVGGFVGMFEKLAAVEPSAVLPGGGSQLVNIWGGSSFKFLLTNILLTSIGVWGLPQMVHKYYTISDESQINKATVISTLFAIVIGVGAYLVGSTGHLFIPAAADGMPSVGYDNVMPTILMKALTGNVWLNILLSVIMLLLLSASMSTLASIVLTSSSAISVDIIKVIKPDISEKKQMLIMRLLCLLFVALSFVFATLNISFIVNLMSFSWGVVAGSFIGPYIWGLYSKKVTKAGAWAGTLSGLVVVGAALAVITAMSGFDAAKALAPEMGVAAMAVSVIVVPIVSAFTKKLDEKFVESCFVKEK